MLAGIAFFGVITANLAAVFMDRAPEEEDAEQLRHNDAPGKWHRSRWSFDAGSEAPLR